MINQTYRQLRGWSLGSNLARRSKPKVSLVRVSKPSNVRRLCHLPSIQPAPANSIAQPLWFEFALGAIAVYDERTLRLESPPDCGV